MLDFIEKYFQLKENYLIKEKYKKTIISFLIHKLHFPMRIFLPLPLRMHVKRTDWTKKRELVTDEMWGRPQIDNSLQQYSNLRLEIPNTQAYYLYIRWMRNLTSELMFESNQQLIKNDKPIKLFTNERQMVSTNSKIRWNEHLHICRDERIYKWNVTAGKIMPSNERHAMEILLENR